MNPHRQNRRQVLLASLAVLPAAGCHGTESMARELLLQSFTQANDVLNALASAKVRVHSRGWNWAQTLIHCAQSIEYSMTGFPQSKSRLFQATAGSAAFALFELRGRMFHDLTEPIPGAPDLEVSQGEDQALERLRTAMSAFSRWETGLMPHFAYGRLTKAQYELAHSMHLANHLSQFQVG